MVAYLSEPRGRMPRDVRPQPADGLAHLRQIGRDGSYTGQHIDLTNFSNDPDVVACLSDLDCVSIFLDLLDRRQHRVGGQDERVKGSEKHE
jgi:hypothetical protein